MGEYLGSCQCGAVQFRIVNELEQPGRCNCSYCRRAWNAGHYVEMSDFELTSGEADLGEYRFATRTAAHHFCRRCGISVFSHLRWQGEERYVVNLGCLEGFDLFSMADLPVNDGASY